MSPPFSIDGCATVDNGSIQLADIGPHVLSSPDRLRGKLILGYTQLTGWNEVEGLPVWNGVRGEVAGEALESLKCDVLVWWPSVWHIPLETGFDEARGECSIVPVQDEVDGGEGTKGLALVIQNIRWDDSNPEGVEVGRGIEAVSGVGSQVVVIESEFVGIPKEIEDTGTKV